MNKRHRVVVRLTDQERAALQELCNYYGQTEQGLMKAAFALMAQSTLKLQERLATEQPNDGGSTFATDIIPTAGTGGQ